MKRIAVVGGGASGLAAAVAVAMRLRQVESCGIPCEVVVYEADERVGRSILATGNGRCNFTNASFEQGDFRNAAFVESALAALEERRGLLGLGGSGCASVAEEPLAPLVSGSADPDASGGLTESNCFGSRSGVDGSSVSTFRLSGRGSVASFSNPVCRFFASLGLVWREEAGGRCYPATNKASTVLDVLRAAAAAMDVREQCGCGVVAVEAPQARAEEGAPTRRSRFTLRMADGAFERADAVILACGGRAGMGLGAGKHAAVELVPESYGFSAEAMRPVLGPLKTDTRAIKGLDGVRVRCSVELQRAGKMVAREQGELLFRSYGVSGIAVFDLSRHAQPDDRLVVDLVPDVPARDVPAFALARYERMVGCGLASTYGDFLRGLALPSVVRAVLAQARISAEAPCDEELLACALAAFKRFSLEVRGVGDARQCQVARGGLAVNAFCPETMEACALPGFFAAGEALDVDARCGGFNLHWAWSSGLLAGISAAERILEG